MKIRWGLIIWLTNLLMFLFFNNIFILNNISMYSNLILSFSISILMFSILSILYILFNMKTLSSRCSLSYLFIFFLFFSFHESSSVHLSRRNWWNESSVNCIMEWRYIHWHHKWYDHKNEPLNNVESNEFCRSLFWLIHLFFILWIHFLFSFSLISYVTYFYI